MVPNNQDSENVIIDNPIKNLKRETMNKTPSNFPTYCSKQVWIRCNSVNCLINLLPKL